MRRPDSGGQPPGAQNHRYLSWVQWTQFGDLFLGELGL